MELWTTTSHQTIHVMPLLRVALAVAFLIGCGSIPGCDCKRRAHPYPKSPNLISYTALSCRAHSASIVDFGGVGDGKMLNTKAFEAAVANLSHYGRRGGGLLFIPAGRWLTGSIVLTSNFTLFLHKDAVILASQDMRSWPLLVALPSYGTGRDTNSTLRYQSFIYGTNLTNVVITGNNGTIDGQGLVWWKAFKSKKMLYTRPDMIELMYSHNIQISSITLRNSPYWTVHPVYCSNILVQALTILAPTHSPNTDGINPDSCKNVKIADCFIMNGDDCIALKSGWDEYGIAVGIPTENVWIRNITCICPTSATLAIGSEMSGGIQNVLAEDLTATGTESLVRIKTAPGRGGFVRGIHTRRAMLDTMKMAFWMTSNYKSHPNQNYNASALPKVQGINYRDVVGRNVLTAGRMEGIEGDEFSDICLANVTIGGTGKPRKGMWRCSAVRGRSSGVVPATCDLLAEHTDIMDCDFKGRYPPEDPFEMHKCALDIAV